MESVGARIKQIRISKGITQAELADALSTTKATISRYECDKRELRFEQAQNIANFLGVSVFELYGFSSQGQATLENFQRILVRAKEMIQHNSEGIPDEATLKQTEELQIFTKEIEEKLKNAINVVTFAHKMQVQSNLRIEAEEEKAKRSLQPDSAIKLKNKRIDNLISMFTAYPYDVQTRILDIVETFGKLNGVGQKHAVGRIKELAELPRYQVQQENGDDA